jgi:large subunit ribosomal protein L21
MFAIVNHYGKQYKLEAGRYVDIDRVSQEPDSTLDFNDVLMVVNGSDIKVGAPSVAGAKVTVKILNHYRGEKIRVFKMRCKKGYRRTQGHRQSMTRVQVVAIEVA